MCFILEMVFDFLFWFNWNTCLASKAVAKYFNSELTQISTILPSLHKNGLRQFPNFTTTMLSQRLLKSFAYE